MNIERKRKNERRFGSLARGVVFEHENTFYMTIKPVDTDFNNTYEVYDITYNAVNLYSGELEWFNLDCMVEVPPNATLQI
jgi:hypothetical protein